jgi:phosphohistidine phosphatase SixA
MWINDLVAVEERDLLLVGHMPNLPRVLTLLVTGSEVELLPFPLHGMIALRAAGTRWQEEWRIEGRTSG